MKPNDIIINTILYYCHRYDRPMFVGELSTLIGWSIERTELFVQYMIEQNLLRCASIEEATKIGGNKNSSIIILCSCANPRLAHLE
jgi:hypothetical protein